jgi:phosphoribosylglycinamide formyltransferase-1
MISGNGSNMLSLLEELKNEPLINFSLIVSNNSSSPGLQKAQQLGYNCKVLEYRNNKKNFERDLHSLLIREGIHLVCLAGFMKILSLAFTRKWKKRILNIHPSLLPKFKGLNTHLRALESGEKMHGCTVHYVNERLDDGEILDQVMVEVMKDDNPVTLASKVLIEEHKLYSKVVRKLVTKENQFLTNSSL